MRLKIGIITIIACCLFLGSCEIVNINEITETSTEEITTAEIPQPYPVIIGDTLIIEAPKRVLCLSPALLEILYEMGYNDLVVGRGSYCDYPPLAVELPNAGSSANPNLSTVKNLNPDLIITSSPIADKDLFELNESGITTLLIPSPKSLTDFLNIYQAIGLAFEGIFIGKETGETAFSAISKACDNKEVVDMGKFIYITENLSVATGDTLESGILSCFGTNLASIYSNYDYELEKLLDNQPEIILLSDIFTMSDLENHKIYSELDAVKNNKVIFINNMYFERPTVRITELVENFITEYKKLK